MTYLVLGFTAKGKDIFGLAIRDLVDTEPFVRGTDQARKLLLNILDVCRDIHVRQSVSIDHVKTRNKHTVQSGCQWVVDINDDHLPVRLALIQESHDTENLDLLDLTDGSDMFTDLDNIDRVIVTTSLGLRMLLVRVFPGLERVCESHRA